MWISVTPQLPVPDVLAAQRYYRDVLGFKVGWIADDQSYGAVYMDANEVFLVRVDGRPARVVCCARVDDVEAEYRARREAGARVVAELETRPWAMREFAVEDPYGHVFRIGQSTMMT